MPPDIHRARPLEIAKGTTPWVLVFVCDVPPLLLASGIFLLAIAMGAGPLLGTTSAMLNILRASYI
jgi:hypothetical protein